MAAESTRPAGWPWVEPTTAYWQRTDAAEAWQGRLTPPFRYRMPIALGDGQVLALPIRRLPNSPDGALASLIANQASHEVIDRLSRAMGVVAQGFAPEVVIGLPTLGMVFAPGVAAALRHARWVPMGYSRKFWYEDTMSTTVTSVTTPGAGKAIYIDPNQLPLIIGCRALIVDDVVSSARTLQQVWDLLERLGAQVVGAVVAMRQGSAWRETLAPERQALLGSVFDSPLLALRNDGWWPQAGDAPSHLKTLRG
jgi:adenine/guanine phosphoribosyltransferase-like PRPP-binding protein